MLLKDYLLLNLGKVTVAEALSWQSDMAARRRSDASRDLLAFWRPRVSEDGYGEGGLAAFAIVGTRRFMGEMAEDEFANGMRSVVTQVVEALRLEPGAPSIDTSLHGGVAVASVAFPSEAVAATDYRALSNAVAYYFEEVFGYAPNAQHPVAYEESLRLEER